VHEFEALILTEPRSLRRIFPDDEAGLERLALSVRDLEPELINDDDPPSKRIPAPTMPPHAQPKTETISGDDSSQAEQQDVCFTAPGLPRTKNRYIPFTH